MTRQFHRPARLDPEVAEAIEGGEDPAVAFIKPYTVLSADPVVIF